ncbi:phosphate ABC transporter permease [Mycoplasma wenyonii str. Massachusetts]|uniref:Phosphate ABC transporter permease n=1 Tax=Mycoplasma wenyonii (strain Massachusetts) TaxID=1197325 RepID=I6YLL7_MYCWM|nr:phosphate ABC transporter permease [Mycoplasma wenyonii]AFN65199.1 phosphate ABC transporter permease [Mycoplasma wenyonii str. Massachusetts]
MLKSFSVISFTFLFGSLSLFLGFIFYKAICSIIEHGPKKFFWSWATTKGAPEVSIYAPLIYTLILVVGSVWGTNKIALKIAKSLLKLKVRIQKLFSGLLRVISILPSFVISFVLFEAIMPQIIKAFGYYSSYSLIWIAICFFSLLFPITCLSYLDWFNSREIKGMNSALLSLALDDKHREKIYLKCSKRVIYLTWATSLVKALGESVALSWFLSSDRYDKPFSSWSNFFNTRSHTISSLISSFYFSEGGGKKSRESMYVFGSALLLLSILLNWFLKKKATEINYKRSKLSQELERSVWKLKSSFERFRYSNSFVYLSRYSGSEIYSKKLLRWRERARVLRSYREKLGVFLVLSFFIAILGVVLLRGMYFTFYNLIKGSRETYSLGGLVVPTWNTALLLFFSVVWALPISFLSAFFVNIYLKKKRRLKSFFLSVISGIGTAPPMLWAIFSSLFFIHYLKLGVGKVSVFAGLLSFTLLSFPFLFNRFSNLFETYSKQYSKTLSYLGLQSFNLIYLVLRDGGAKIKSFLSNLTTKLNGESGLLFITMGASPNPRFTLWGPGQTLTTKFFASLYKYKVTEIKAIVYETIFFIFVFSIFVYSLLTTFWTKRIKKVIKSIRKVSRKSRFNYYWNVNSKNRASFLIRLNTL